VLFDSKKGRNVAVAVLPLSSRVAAAVSHERRAAD
jgi:hypothetical protein